MPHNTDYCIILAGGPGKRLWPCSRRERPKQFLDFLGTGRSLLQLTYGRIAAFIPPENIFVSTFADYQPLVAEQLPDLPAGNIVTEPVQLSTAPAAAWASYHIALRAPEANILVTPCDQHIGSEADFAAEVTDGLRFVENNDAFLALGVPAREATSAYGYIQIGHQVQPHLYTVQSFTEKPETAYAKAFVETGEFLWNTGLFLWNARGVRALVREVASTIAEAVEREGEGITLEREAEILRRYYPTSQRRSIDLVILEKSRRNVYVRECSFAWADIGCWPELYAVSRKDADGNAVVGRSKALFSDSSNNLVCIPDGVAAVLHGLDGYLVASSGNVVVVCPNNNPTLVRKLLNEAQVAFGEDCV
ncbi:MAG: NTP transferase domain-containing protein [Alloprevotella sp.]|nr:NTP transferase domain-containing protein [Alloprevotella sp.]